MTQISVQFFKFWLQTFLCALHMRGAGVRQRRAESMCRIQGFWLLSLLFGSFLSFLFSSLPLPLIALSSWTLFPSLSYWKDDLPSEVLLYLCCQYHDCVALRQSCKHAKESRSSHSVLAICPTFYVPSKSCLSFYISRDLDGCFLSSSRVYSYFLQKDLFLNCLFLYTRSAPLSLC